MPKPLDPKYQLLGGFTLEQRGDFYHNHNVWVKSSEIMTPEF